MVDAPPWLIAARQHVVLTKAEEDGLWRRWQHGGDLSARDRLLEHCVRWLFRLMPRMRGAIDEGDLLQVGRLALIRHGHKYNPDHESGMRFASFVGKHAMHSMRVEVRRHGFAVALPLPAALPGFVQLDHPVGDHDDLDLLDTMASDGPSPERAAVEDELDRLRKELVGECLSQLTPRYREVIERHVMRGETLESIGVDLGISRERVRQMVVGARSTLGRAARRCGITASNYRSLLADE